MQPDESRAESLFHEALACPDETERRQLLERAAPGDAALQGRVRDLLAAHAKASRFLAGPAAPESHGEDVGGWIGRYRLLEKLGEGGFGSVWLAEQRVPVVRRVALKVIKLGMDTRAVIARFEAERQTLALMDHPHIARVLDAGSTDAGRPYFVMELVQGTSIVEFCNSRELDTRERLALFVSVCNAIQHAHQKGIIHRDIKPSNVLVALHDGVPVPKVIDFGIAKATQSELTARTFFTEHRQLVGTPAYMSPEQAEMSGLDVDTRSDIYSLGVLLYELLTGTTPLDAKGLLESGYAAWMRAVRETEPEKPSTRVSTLGAAGATVAAQRQVALRRLGQMLRGDLDWIAMRCLEKDRNRRYPSAGALAQDITCHLNHLPVSAGPPARAYRLLKFVRRNRAVVAALAAVSAALVLGIVGTTMGLLSAQRESRRSADLATAAEGAAYEARASAERARSETERAEREAARAQAAEATATERARQLGEVVRFQAAQLSGIDVAAMGERLRDGWLAEVRRSLRSAGEKDAAIAQRVSRLEAELPRMNLTNLALTMLDETIFDRALAAADRSFEDQPRVRAQILQSLATTMAGLGLLERAREPQRRALEIRRLLGGEDGLETLESLESTGQLEAQCGRLAEAERILRLVLETRRRVQGDDSAAVGVTAQNVAAVLLQESCPDEAEPYFREAIARSAAASPRRAVDALDSMNNLCVVWQAQGRAAEVEPLLRIVVDDSIRLRGWGHAATLSSLDTLGTLLKDLSRFEEAEAISLAALAGRSQTLGDDHPDTLVSLNNVGAVFLAQSKFDEAEYMFREALSGCRRALGSAHPFTLGTSGNLCALLHMSGRDEEALPLLREQLEACRRALGEHHETTIIAGNSLGQALSSLGRTSEALPVLREAVEACRVTYGEQHPSTLVVKNNYALALWASDALDDAHTVLDQVLAGRRVQFGSESVEVVNTLSALGRILLKQGRYAEAEPLLRESLAVPAGPRTPKWSRAFLAGLLGASLAGQGKHEEADGYLVEGYRDFEPPPGRQGLKHDALVRLIEHYRAWGRADQAAYYEGLLTADTDSAGSAR